MDGVGSADSAGSAGSVGQPLHPESGSSTSGEKREHKSRRRSSRRSRDELHDRIDKLVKQRRLFAISAAFLAMASIGLTVGLLVTQSATRDAQIASEAQRNQLETGMRESASRLAVVQRDLRKAQESIHTLVDERIPGLGAIELYRPIEIQRNYIRDITFKRLDDSKRKGLEYKVVVENTSSSPIKPSLSVQIFDDVGVQLGDSDPIGLGDEDQILRAGEIRSYFAIFDGGNSQTPSYFRIVSAD